MLGVPGKGEVRLKCTEIAFAEFPTLLFGSHPETGASYFDATAYLNNRTEPVNINNFFVQWRSQIGQLCECYGIKPDMVCLINEEGHRLIEANFFCLFISFVEPGFLGYICDRIFEIMTNGFTVSDLFLLQIVGDRLPKRVLRQLSEDEKEKPNK